ncbi:MAG: translation initiation factor IF-2 N-terminal domain-containing protein, partial [Campylobacterota bacterium]|nr:translation initiation factor IF-2 N-terminal domain-containing protein [Campylobacterota bacterium]
MSDKVRVHEVAKELGILSKEVVEKAKSMGLDIKTASSSLTMEEAEKLANFIINGAPKEVQKPKSRIKKVVKKETAPVETKTQETQKVVIPEKKEEKPPITSPTVESKEEKKSASGNIEKKDDKKEIAVEKKSETKESEKPAPVKKEKESKLNLKVIEPKVRSRLKIVKKKRPVVEETYTNNNVSPDLSKLSSYGKMSAEVLEELAKKKNKKTSSTPTSKKDSGKKIDIFGGSISSVSMDYEDNEVVLLDLNESVKDKIADEAPRPPRPKKPAGRNAGKTQGRRKKNVSRDVRKKYVKDKIDDEIVTHVEIPEDIRVYEFAEKVKRPLADV